MAGLAPYCRPDHLSTIFSLLQPWPMKVLVDNVLGGQALGGVAGQVAAFLPGSDGAPGLLAWVAVGGLVLFAASSGLDALLTYSWVRTGQGMVYRLGRDLFARIVRRSLLFHSRNSVGELAGACYNRFLGGAYRSRQPPLCAPPCRHHHGGRDCRHADDEPDAHPPIACCSSFYGGDGCGFSRAYEGGEQGKAAHRKPDAESVCSVS